MIYHMNERILFHAAALNKQKSLAFCLQLNYKQLVWSVIVSRLLSGRPGLCAGSTEQVQQQTAEYITENSVVVSDKTTLRNGCLFSSTF